MIAYPGYTVGRIQEELSWREVDLLLSKWEDTPPVSVRIRRVEQMLAQHTGIKFTKAEQNEDEIYQSFMRLSQL